MKLIGPFRSAFGYSRIVLYATPGLPSFMHYGNQLILSQPVRVTNLLSTCVLRDFLSTELTFSFTKSFFLAIMTTFYTSTSPKSYKPKFQSYYRPIYSVLNPAPTILKKDSSQINQQETDVQSKNKSFTKVIDSKNLKNDDSHDFFIISKENRIENPTSFYGCFYLGPFEPGQGITIGNALRRTLLSSIPSYAITAVEIEGVSHEYSTIPGVKETVLDILLCLNETVLTSQTFWDHNKISIGYLKKQGPGIVYARDLRLPPELECVNPNQYIATLSDNGYLNLKFQIQYGSQWTDIKGQNWYNPMKQNETDSIYYDSLFTTLSNSYELIEQPWPTLKNDELVTDPVKDNSIFATTKSSVNTVSELNSGTAQNPMSLQNLANYVTNRKNFTGSETLPLLLNPNFSPIRKINYLVESSSVKSTISLQETGDNSEVSSTELYQKQRNYVELFKPKVASEIVILEIWTNGSIHPRSALALALQTCARTFTKLGQIIF